MSMLDSFFNKGFKAAKCKTLLKLSIPRIKLLRNRREIQLRNMRRDIAKLLETGQEATARIRVEHIIREENMLAAQEIIELFCELIAVRLPIIESQRECPLDLKEAISSVCFAAPRCADLPELLQVQFLFGAKYGKEFLSAATELRPDCGVNRQLIELLSVRAPSPEKKLKLLKEIAVEHDLDWDPAPSETEFFKKHEDLLDGPTKMVSGSTLPLHEEKHNEELPSIHDSPTKEQPGSDSDSDMFEFPEVPKVSVRPGPSAATAPDTVAPLVMLPLEVDLDSPSHSAHFEDVNQGQTEGRSSVPKDESHTSFDKMESKQFVPFISPPPLSPRSHSARHSDPPVILSAKYSDSPASLSARYSDPPASLSARYSDTPASLSSTKSEPEIDLKDVLAAANAAAESAERAAAAARSAASLAQVRINELTKKKSEHVLDSSSENPFYASGSNESTIAEEGHFNFNEPHIAGNSDGSERNDLEPHQDHYYTSSSFPSFDTLKEDLYSSLPSDHAVDNKSSTHQPQRLPSMDDDPYFSYPNLFTSQSSNIGSHTHSDNDRSTRDL
ncbi:putative vacuolar protein sorting-associated protein Ist1 [Lupinus albus]|uniref:Putative vacuolar protein sorting-associated protein Ist1 n=1 Tax=Lupinus albus TaxID=3870 RepID=A0A6A4QV18_LUPAL|nr:putative vacuolar protein sorting-associated protein Ist1 [Lupinus albus]